MYLYVVESKLPRFFTINTLFLFLPNSIFSTTFSNIEKGRKKQDSSFSAVYRDTRQVGGTIGEEIYVEEG